MINSFGAPTSKPYYFHRPSFLMSGGYNSWGSGYSSIHSWTYLLSGEDATRGFRCVRTINSND